MDLEQILHNLKRISPEILAEKLNVSVCQASNICIEYVKKGLLEMRFEVICPECSSTVLFKSVMDIPDKIHCECGNNFMPMRENIRIVFEVV